MHNSFVIQKVYGREILDSRGNPTVEAEVILQNGARDMARPLKRSIEQGYLKVLSGSAVKFSMERTVFA